MVLLVKVALAFMAMQSTLKKQSLAFLRGGHTISTLVAYVSILLTTCRFHTVHCTIVDESLKILKNIAEFEKQMTCVPNEVGLVVPFLLHSDWLHVCQLDVRAQRLHLGPAEHFFHTMSDITNAGGSRHTVGTHVLLHTPHRPDRMRYQSLDSASASAYHDGIPKDAQTKKLPRVSQLPQGLAVMAD